VRGSIIHVEFTYDNSVSNPRNPDRPPRRVLYGQNSSDEMGDLWLQLITLTTAERSRLLADAVPKALAEDTVGYEMLLRADPDNLSLKQGKAATHYNLGSLLASQRRLDDAVTEFEKAIALRPEHSETYNNLGVVLKAQGRLDAAIESFRRALAVDAKNRAARDNLDAALLLKKQLR
jgi:tetratricopeptide (TPR) repeat protein